MAHSTQSRFLLSLEKCKMSKTASLTPRRTLAFSPVRGCGRNADSTWRNKTLQQRVKINIRAEPRVQSLLTWSDLREKLSLSWHLAIMQIISPFKTWIWHFRGLRWNRNKRQSCFWNSIYQCFANMRVCWSGQIRENLKLNWQLWIMQIFSQLITWFRFKKQ